MKKYIGTKLVEAEPAWRLNGKVYAWDALQMAMCYALLAAEAGRATDELA